VDFIEICNVYIGKMIIKAAKRIFNSDKICRSYSDLNFGITFLEHSVVTSLYNSMRRIGSHTRSCVILFLFLLCHCEERENSCSWLDVRTGTLANCVCVSACVWRIVQPVKQTGVTGCSASTAERLTTKDVSSATVTDLARPVSCRFLL